MQLGGGRNGTRDRPQEAGAESALSRCQQRRATGSLISKSPALAGGLHSEAEVISAFKHLGRRGQGSHGGLEPGLSSPTTAAKMQEDPKFYRAAAGKGYSRPLGPTAGGPEQQATAPLHIRGSPE